MHSFWIHHKGDHVGIATQDIKAGEHITGMYMDDNSVCNIVAKNDIPLGHKIALVEHATGDDVIEYGQVVGITRIPWHVGDYVHTHNIQSKRWQA